MSHMRDGPVRRQLSWGSSCPYPPTLVFFGGGFLFIFVFFCAFLPSFPGFYPPTPFFWGGGFSCLFLFFFCARSCLLFLVFLKRRALLFSFLSSKIGDANLFTKYLFKILVPLNLPLPKQQSDGFPLEFLSKGPQISGSPKPHPSKPHPCNMPQAKTEVALQFLEIALQKLHCNIRFSAVRTSFVPKAALQQTKNCTAT